MSDPHNKKKSQLCLTVGVFFILASIGLLVFVFYLQWKNSVMS